MSHSVINSKYLSCQQAADYLGVSVKTIRRWAQSGILEGRKVGSRGDWRYMHKQLDRMVYSQDVQVSKIRVNNNSKELEQSEEMFSKTFHASPVAMTIVRASDGMMVDANDNYFKLMGYKRNELIGRTAAELDGKKDHTSAESLRQLRAIVYTKRQIEFETERVMANGDIKKIRGTYAAIKINGEKHIVTSHMDATERVRAEQVDHYLAALTTNIADAVVSIDNNHNVVTWNKGAEGLYGWKEEEVTGKKLSSILRQRPVDKIPLKEIRKIVAINGFWRGESVHRRKDGSTVPVHTSVAAIKNDKGKIIGRVAVYRDISARKKAEQLLRDREARYRLLFDSMVSGFCVVEMLCNKRGEVYDYRFLEANPAYTKMIGISNIQGKTLRQLSPAISDKWLEVVSDVVATGKDNRSTNYSYSVDKWFDVHVMRVGRKRSCMAALLVKDITEHMNIEEERASYTKKMVNTLESISDAFFQVDAEGSVVLVNEEFVRMSRVSRRKVLGSNIKEIFSNESWFPKRYEAFLQVMSTNKSVHYVDYYRRRKIWVDVRAYPTEGGVSWFIRDITQQKLAEEKQVMLTKLTLEREELIKISKVKDEFIGIASHQLRTPATAVKQYIGMLLDGLGGSLNDDQRSYLETAYASNERQIKLINDLLKTAQIDADAYSLSRSYQDIASLLRNTISSLQPSVDQRQQSIVMNNRSNGANANIDPIEIDLVFSNLLENASKYSPDKSKITVTLSRKADVLQVSISDKGFGIHNDDQRKIFDKFTRIHNEQSDAVSGTGLGLYWVKQIVQMHGGTVTVSSSLNKGSTFKVTLPL